MKKLLAGMVLMVTFGMCLSTFGNTPYILIYNVSTSVSGADDDTGAKAQVPLKGYLILNLSDSTTVADANLIIYGKDANTPKKQKVYTEFDYHTGSDVHFVDIWQVGDYFFLEIGNYGDSEVVYFDVLLMGKEKSKNVGPLVGSEDVASSLKGVIEVWDGILLGPSPDQDISGTGNASLTLNNSGTKWANGNNDEDEQKTQAQVVEEVIGPDGILTGQGYHAVVLP